MAESAIAVTEKIPLSTARGDLGGLLSRAQWRGDRFILTAHGRPQGVLISMEDFRFLEEAEDQADLESVRGVVAHQS